MWRRRTRGMRRRIMSPSEREIPLRNLPHLVATTVVVVWVLQVLKIPGDFSFVSPLADECHSCKVAFVCSVDI